MASASPLPAPCPTCPQALLYFNARYFMEGNNSLQLYASNIFRNSPPGNATFTYNVRCC